MSYLSTGSAAQFVELKVQELIVNLSDPIMSVLSASSSVAVIDVGQTIDTVRAAIFLDDSAATYAPIVAASRSVSGSTVTLQLSAIPAAADAIALYFVVVV